MIQSSDLILKGLLSLVKKKKICIKLKKISKHQIVDIVKNGFTEQKKLSIQNCFCTLLFTIPSTAEVKPFQQKVLLIWLDPLKTFICPQIKFT